MCCNSCFIKTLIKWITFYINYVPLTTPYSGDWWLIQWFWDKEENTTPSYLLHISTSILWTLQKLYQFWNRHIISSSIKTATKSFITFTCLFRSYLFGLHLNLSSWMKYEVSGPSTTRKKSFLLQTSPSNCPHMFLSVFWWITGGRHLLDLVKALWPDTWSGLWVWEDPDTPLPFMRYSFHSHLSEYE